MIILPLSLSLSLSLSLTHTHAHTLTHTHTYSWTSTVVQTSDHLPPQRWFCMRSEVFPQWARHRCWWSVCLKRGKRFLSRAFSPQGVKHVNTFSSRPPRATQSGDLWRATADQPSIMGAGAGPFTFAGETFYTRNCLDWSCLQTLSEWLSLL